MSEESQEGARSSGLEPERASDRSPREILITVTLAAGFFVLMLLQERAVLLALTESAPLPTLLWRGMWPLLAIALALLLPIRARLLFLSGIGLFWALIVIGDAAYLRFFGSVTSLVSLGTTHQLWDVRDSVVDVLRPGDWAYLVGFLVMGLVALLPSRLLIGSDAPAMTPRHRLRGSAGVAAVLVLVTIVAWLTPIYEDTHHIGREKWVMPWEHWGSRYSHAAYAGTFGLYNYHANDLVRFLDFGRSRSDLTDERLSAIDRILARKDGLNEIESPLHGIAHGRRVVVIQLEAIVHWLLDLEVDGEPVMPFLSSLSRRGLSWDYVFDVTSVGRTSDAEFAVMTGMLPDTSRPNAFAHSDRARVYLPRKLQSLGYSTASYHGYKRSFWNRDYAHPVYGIEEMHFQEVFGGQPVMGLGVPDDVVYEYVAERLAEEETPSFSFVISVSSHHPFVYTPEAYRTAFPNLTLEDGWGLLGPYLRSARYTDDALAGFFARLEESGLLEDTVFVIYGDHDMGMLHTNKTLPGMSPYAYTVAEERVPFIVVVPGQEERIAAHRGAYASATGGLHDTFPTLMHLLGEPVPRGVMGTHLFVPDALRDPVPLVPRNGEALFAYRGCIFTKRGSGCVPSREGAVPTVPEDAPSLIEGFRDQIIVRDLLDHPEYWERTPSARAISVANSADR